MRHWIKGLVLVIAVVLIIAGALFFVLSHAPSYEVKMPDGTTLRVEKINYGKRDSFLPGGWWQRLKENIAKRLPKKWGDQLFKPSQSTSSWSGASGQGQAYSTNSDALHLWFTRRSVDGTGYENVGVFSGELVDDDGCVYAYAQAGGEDRGLLPAAVVTGVPAGSGFRAVATSVQGAGSGSGVGGGQVGRPGSMTSYSFTNSTTSGARGGVRAGGGGGGWSTVASGASGTSGVSGLRWGGAGSTGPQASVAWLTFMSFPRFDKMLHLRVYDFQHTLLGKFDLPNPGMLPNRAPPGWTPTKIPVTRNEGDLSFTLSDLTIKTNRYRGAQGGTEQEEAKEIAPQFEIRERGSPVDSWSAVDMDLVGASGNIAPKNIPPALYLCPREPAWKLSVKFAGSESSSLASNASWTAKGLSIPSEGQWTAWADDHLLQGVTVRLVSFAGAGLMVYSNDLPVSGDVPDGGRLGLTISNGPPSFIRAVPGGAPIIASGGGGGGGSGTFFGGGPGGPFVPTLATVSVRAPTTSIAVKLTGLKPDQRFTVRAIDDQGRETYGREITTGSWNARATGPIPYIQAPTRGGLTFVSLNLASDAKKVDLILCIHDLRTEDFILKPPGNN